MGPAASSIRDGHHSERCTCEDDQLYYHCVWRLYQVGWLLWSSCDFETRRSRMHEVIIGHRLPSMLFLGFGREADWAERHEQHTSALRRPCIGHLP